MIRRIIDLTLILAILLSAYRSWQSSQERNRLINSYNHLYKITGAFPIQDPTQLHIVALETTDPLSFAWRFYVPPNDNPEVRTDSGSGYSAFGLNPGSEASEFIARVRLRHTPNGGTQVYTNFGSTSGFTTLGTPAGNLLTPDRWNDVKVEQLGIPQMAILRPNQSTVLLRLTLPDDLAAEARKQHPNQPFNPVFFQISIVPPNAPKP